MSLLGEVEAIVRDIRDVDDGVVPVLAVEGCVETLHEGLKHHCEVGTSVVSAA